MAIELITGRAGVPHVDSADVRAFNRAVYGVGVYILEGASSELIDANNVNVAAGELMCEGAHIRITGAGETLTIDNGLSAYKRNDIIAAHYLRDEDGIESVQLLVIKGEPSIDNPTDPDMPTSGKLADEASDVYWPLYRVVIDGLTPQPPVALAGRQAWYTLGLGTEIPAGADLNDYTEPGKYAYYGGSGANIANVPNDSTTLGFMLTVEKETAGFSKQTVHVISQGTTYARLFDANGFYSWNCISGVDSIIAESELYPPTMWSWKKYANGVVIAWGTKTATTSATGTLTIYSDYLPFAIYNAKTYLGSAVSGDTNSQPGFCSMSNAQQVLGFVKKTSSGSAQVFAYFLVIGTWK